MTEEQRLLYTEKNQIATVTLCRPDIHNAFDDKLITELKAKFLDLARRDDLRAVVLTGQGKSFSAGADLNWMKRMKDYSRRENLEDAYELADMIEAIFTCPLPTIARVQGSAFGGGVGLIAACDYAFTVERAKFGFTEARLGIAPACIARPVVFRLGRRHSRNLFLTGEIFKADRALAMGLVDEVVAGEEELDQVVAQQIDKLLQCSPSAQAACKILVREVAHGDATGARELGAQTIADLRTSPAGQEGLAAFLEKRKPSWVPE